MSNQQQKKPGCFAISFTGVVLVILVTFIIIIPLSKCSNGSSQSETASWSSGLDSGTILDTEKVMAAMSIDQIKASNIISDLRLGGIYNIDSISKTVNWEKGERYLLINKDTSYTVYFNLDKTISSINIGLDKVWVRK